MANGIIPSLDRNTNGVPVRGAGLPNYLNYLEVLPTVARVFVSCFALCLCPVHNSAARKMTAKTGPIARLGNNPC
jgi:hypothetical protein